MIKNQKEIHLINTCDAVFDEQKLIDAIKWYSSKPVYSTKKISMHGRYPAVSIYDEKIHIHKLLMMYWINAPIPNDFCVHHNNENKLDATKENLSLVNRSYHQRKHNEGKTISDSQKMAITAWNNKRWAAYRQANAIHDKE